RGYAREDEANFIGYLVCINSTEPYVRYSGYLYGLKVLDTLSKGNLDRSNDINEGPKADLRVRSQFWEKNKSSTLSALSRRIFSAYLRVNRVAGGIKNYNEDVQLIIGYYLKYPQRQPGGGTSGDRLPNEGAASPDTQPEPSPSAERTPNTF